MKAMVMAAGLGTRLRPLTDFLPKPMMPVANRPVLHHLLNLLRRHDVREVGINVHAFSEMIENYFGDGSCLDMSILWSHEAGAARHGRRDEEAAGLLGRRDDPHHVGRRPARRRRDCPAGPPPPHGRARDPHREAGQRPVLVRRRHSRPRHAGARVPGEADARRGALRSRQLRRLRDRARAPRADPRRHVRRLRHRRLALARRRERGGLRVHDDGVLERRGRPRRAPQHDPRRRARPRARRHPGRGGRPGCLGGGGLPDRRLGSARRAGRPRPRRRHRDGAQVRGPAAIGADCRVGEGAAIRSAALLPGTAVPDEGLAIAGIFGDASKLADAVLRYPAAG